MFPNRPEHMRAPPRRSIKSENEVSPEAHTPSISISDGTMGGAANAVKMVLRNGLRKVAVLPGIADEA
jgi:hypothetical protein